MMSEHLLFQTDGSIPEFDLNRVDDPNNHTAGHYFAHDQPDAWKNARIRMLKRVQASNRYHEFVELTGDSLGFHQHGVDSYKKWDTSFRELLAILITITCGLSGRGTEMTSLRYMNGMDGDRNIYIEDGQIMIITEYHKSMALMDNVKVIPRFLCYRISQLLGIYLQDVIPFKFMIDESIPHHGFLFGDERGPWSTERLTKVLTRETTAKLGFRMTIQEFRHIAIAIDRKFIRGHEAVADDDDEDEDDVHDLMAAHSTKLAIARYARMGGLTKGLTPESIDIFRKISDRWQRFFKLVSRQGYLATRPELELELEPDPEVSMETKITKQLRNLYGQQSDFRSSEQREAVMAAANGINELFVILPTGAGKSQTFMLPALLSDAKTTVVIVPLVALANDIYDRCQNSKIDAIIHGRHQLRQAKVVIIVTESAITERCRQFIVDLYLSNRLARIVFDECHKLIHDMNYRPKLIQLRHICINVQFIFLTATFPPTMADDFIEQMIIQSPTIIRAANHKPKIRYNVKVVTGMSIKRQMHEIIERSIESCQGLEKVLLFCRSRNECEGWAQRFQCGVYHSTSDNKEQTLTDWKSGPLCATGSLGAGVDIQGIKCIIHIGLPYGMINYDQEVGRGGRNGEIVESTVLLSDEEFNKLSDMNGELMGPDDKAMREYLITTGCRRTGMSVYMNGESYSTDCHELKAELCDNCMKSSSNVNMVLRRKRTDEEVMRRTRQKTSYDQKLEYYRGEIMNEGQRTELILETVKRLQGFCSVCWLLDGLEIEEHDSKKCPDLERALGETFSSFKARNLRYVPYTCCYRCGLPQKLCEHLKDGVCVLKDVIYPLVLMSWLKRDELEVEWIIEDVADGRKFKEVREFGKWITEGTRWLDYQAANCFCLFEGIIKGRRGLEVD